MRIPVRQKTSHPPSAERILINSKKPGISGLFKQSFILFSHLISYTRLQPFRQLILHLKLVSVLFPCHCHHSLWRDSFAFCPCQISRHGSDLYLCITRSAGRTPGSQRAVHTMPGLPMHDIHSSDKSQTPHRLSYGFSPSPARSPSIRPYIHTAPSLPVPVQIERHRNCTLSVLISVNQCLKQCLSPFFFVKNSVKTPNT